MATPFVEWKDKYLIHIASIDQQHRSLVDMINDLYAELSSRIDDKDTEESFRKAVKKAVNYVKFHFFEEEKLMKEANYPGLSHQQSEHKKFVGKLLDYVKRFESGNMSSAFDFVVFLQDWLLGHIAIVDNDLGIFMKKRQS